MKTWIFLGLIVISSTSLMGQDFDNYVPIVCEGELPKDITLSAEEKFNIEISKDYNQNSGNLSDASHRKFVLESTYSLDLLMTRGTVLFGDQLTQYVNKVADKLLENDPELRSSLKFHCIRSSITNAFTTNSGLIFVSIGLLSQLENESQLAFVLAHEISHYKNKHITRGYENKIEVLKNNRFSSSSNAIYQLSNYSKEQEFEADSLGFNIISESSFNVEECLQSFDVIQFSNLPFELYDFDHSFLETSRCEIPENLILSEPNPINFDNKEDDKYSTHPNIGKRKARVMGFEKLLSAKPPNHSSFKSDPETFTKIRKIARFEIVKLNIVEREYITGLYQIQYLLKENPESTFLQNLEYQALYGITKYHDYLINQKYLDADDVEGVISVPLYLFENLDSEAARSLILRYFWDKSQVNPDNELLKEYIRDIVQDLVYRNSITYSDYIKPVALKNTIEIQPETINEVNLEDSKNSKYEVLEQKKDDNSEKPEFNEKFYLNVLDGCQNLDRLKDIFSMAYTNESQKLEPITIDLKAKKLADDQLALENLLVLNPILIQIDKKGKLDLKKSLESDYYLEQNLLQVSSETPMNITVLDPKSNLQFTVNDYNNLSRINSWMIENQSHSNQIGKIPINSQQNDLNEILNEYGVEHFAFSYQVNYFQRSHRFIKSPLIFASPVIPFYPPCWPIIYARYFKTKRSDLFTLIYDGKKGAMVCEYNYECDFHVNEVALNSIYTEMITNMNK